MREHERESKVINENTNEGHRERERETERQRETERETLFHPAKEIFEKFLGKKKRAVQKTLLYILSLLLLSLYLYLCIYMYLSSGDAVHHILR